MANDDPLAKLLGDARRSTRDQVTATWQLQMDKIRALLSRDWLEQVAKVVDERFNEFEASLKPAFQESRREVVRSLGRHWYDCFTRMREATDDREWLDAVLDTVAGLAKRCIFFSVRGETICYQGRRGFDSDLGVPPDDIALRSAPAFLEVVLSGRSTEAGRKAQDLSRPIAYFVGESRESKVILVPIPTRERVVGVMYVENPLAVAGVEAAAMIAGIILEGRLRGMEPVRPSQVLKAVSSGKPAEPVPVPKKKRHAPAERAARVHAAHLLFQHYGSIRAGDEDSGLVAAIDERRSDFNSQFPDYHEYLDAELTRTLGRQ